MQENLAKLKTRRLHLLWYALEQRDGRVVQLVGPAALKMGYPSERILNFDINQLEQDGAVVEETEHRSASLPGTPYYVTDTGIQLLQEAGLAVDL